MRAFSVSLKEIYGLQGGELTCILADLPFDEAQPDWKRPAVIVVPGGGYWMVSKREGEPIATHFLGKGFQTFILNYACRPDGVRYPEQLKELAAAVDYVRSHAEEYYVNPDEVFAVGFSAGGHLTGNLAVEYEKMEALGFRCRPTAVGLCYPVISNKTSHRDSHENLLAGYSEGEKADLLQTLNLDEGVTDKTPPAFIWSTAKDDLVPSENALLYGLALARHGISYELHVYPQGWHGLSTCDWEVNPGETFMRKNSRWMEDCATFFRLFTKERF